jgi:type IV pilus assembly protein PilQ
MFIINSARIFLLLVIFFLPLQSLPLPPVTVKTLSLDMEDVDVKQALRILAQFLNLNLILSPAVSGQLTLHLHDALPQDALNTVVTARGLVLWHQGNVSFIATSGEMLQHKQDEQKLSEALHEAAQLTTRMWQIQYAKADDIARLLQDNAVSLLSKRGHVRVDTRTNMLCIQDVASQMRELEKVIRQLDIPVRQVRIEARLASVDNDYERELGINFSVKNPTPAGVPHVLAETVTTRFSMAVATLADGSLLDVALAAMENEGRGDLISSPSLFTSNQQTAVIESGEEIPYQEISLSGGTGVAFKKAVLSLKVTPQIMPGNRVMLQLAINQDRPSSRIVLGVPAIATRQITTNVLVRNGQTLVLGGIYELNKESDVQRIPFLGKIPIVGLLFQQQNLKTNKRELLIFVTPTIIA